MSIPIFAFGVRGDMQPYLALAVGLHGALGEKIRAKDGVAWAEEIVERQVGTRTREGARMRETRRHETSRRAPPFAFFVLRAFGNLRGFVFQTPPVTLLVTHFGR
jgi:hypothetical protein